MSLGFSGGGRNDLVRSESGVAAKAAPSVLHGREACYVSQVSMTGQRRSVLVIDDGAMPRYAAKGMLDASSSFRFAGEASGGQEGVRAYERLRPEVVLIDVEMPHMDGAQTTKAILELDGPRPVIVAWTVSDSSDDLIRMIRAGCNGYALKDFGPKELERSLLAAMNGEMPVPRKMMPDVIAKALAAPRPTSDHSEVVTSRERDVLRLVGQGATTKEVARALGISSRSVDSHLRSIYRKLDATNRVQAINKARALGVIPPDDI